MAEKTATQKAASQMSPFDFDAQDIRIDKLLLDPNNYRFLDRKKFKKKVASRFHEESVQRATLESLEHTYQLDELKQSILTNGYVPMERIIVVPYRSKAGFYLVVEGNRRVASLKSLLAEAEDGTINLTPNRLASLSKVPCAVLRSKGTSLKHAERVIMGIRHIAGPKEWGAYQQAILVSELKDEENQDFAHIAEMLGTSSVEAARRYRAINALKSMEGDELFAKKAEPTFYRLFHELVSLPDVRTRFGWSTDTNRFTDEEAARQFYDLICSDAKHDPKIQTYQDVRKLKFIVGNSKAEESLFDRESPYSEALRIGEQGKKKETASSLLQDAKSSLAQIGVLQAKSFKPKDGELIDELIELLSGLKKISTKAN